MALPSLTKRDLFRTLQATFGWGIPLSLFFHGFSPHCLYLVSNTTSAKPQPGTAARGSITRSYGFWLKSRVGRKINYPTHPGGQILCFVFIVSNGTFWEKKGSRVWNWLGCFGRGSLIGESPQMGSARETLGEPAKFQVEASGSQQLWSRLLSSSIQRA
jgi:hypothetical protein